MLQKANLATGMQVMISIAANRLTLLPLHEAQMNWTEAFNAIADTKGDEILIDIPNDFEQEDWVW